MKRAAVLHVSGVVQGVGFRPFVYRTARRLSLVGYVSNLGDAGVRILVQGNQTDIEQLVDEIQNNPPSISRVDRVDVEWTAVNDGLSDFRIASSSVERRPELVPSIPPDIAICDQCIADLTNPSSRWYLYPFTSCAACGPRFSTITSLPYDRPNTTMGRFPLCNTCNAGYTDPSDRRYHAQTTACAQCGPSYWLTDERGTIVSEKNPVIAAAELLGEGRIVAVQGIAGTHIATMTSMPEPVRELRLRKKRSQRPFAIMVRDELIVQQIAEATREELDLLKSWRRPIVLARKRREPGIELGPWREVATESMDAIAPGLDTVGVMLPYSPVHHLLFQHLRESALVMTSANPAGVPMYIDASTITGNLKGIVDYYLLHNRPIAQRADDSVIKFVGRSMPVFIRRARGYVPESIRLSDGRSGHCAIATGPEEKCTGAVLKSGTVYMTQHIGDTDRVESIGFLTDALNHLMHLVGMTTTNVVACDLHPDFLTTELGEKLAEEWDVALVRVQHHHAHLAALEADNALDGNTDIVCITADGFGFGPDGTAWGGEVLSGSFRNFERLGGLEPKSLPGGDLAATYGARSVVGILNPDEVERAFDILDGLPIGSGLRLESGSLSLLVEAKSRNVNTIRSSSAGRYLDAVSTLLGVCSENSYDGECPMKLEAVARPSELRLRPVLKKINGRTVLDTSDALSQVLDLIERREGIPEIAYAAQWYLGEALGKIACMYAVEKGIGHIGFSGGVALNRIITRAVKECVEGEKLIPVFHRRVPPGDGGVSLGQVAVGLAAISDWTA